MKEVRRKTNFGAFYIVTANLDIRNSNILILNFNSNFYFFQIGESGKVGVK